MGFLNPVSNSNGGTVRYSVRPGRNITLQTSLGVIFALVLFLLSFHIFRQWEFSRTSKLKYPLSLTPLLSSKVVVITNSSLSALTGDQSCHYYNCFDVYRCGRIHSSKISIYVYPIVRYVDENGLDIEQLNSMSSEYRDILDAIVSGPYYTADPEKACFLVPSIDVLNQNKLKSLHLVGQAYAALNYWNSGVNHIIFNMLPGAPPNFSTVVEVPRGQALVAGGGFSTWTYRRTFDVSLPIYNPLIRPDMLLNKRNDAMRKWFAVSAQTVIIPTIKRDLVGLADEHPEFLILDRCSGQLSKNATVRCHSDGVYSYPAILQDSIFCVVARSNRLGHTSLLDSMMAGCIPVIIADSYVLPFSEVLDWKKAAVLIYEDNIDDMMSILRGFSDEAVTEMRLQVRYLWGHYFKNMHNITRTTLDILNQRVFSHTAKRHDEWNNPPLMRGPESPLFLPMIAPKSQGFTAVVLTYDRLDSLFQVIQNVVKAPSLAKVLVVWNNQNKSPPQASMWPKINKPLKVVQTSENRLSNRFYPYDEIETEAILAIDDDIVMLTPDELEFGFEVWREFPDRIVGYPSRVHLWDNATRSWKYQSEWTNEVSMVLTGVAFYHKFWSYMYTTSMPKEIRLWVDENMNCEDIAMNFLVTNMTGKAPIKVAPRKKFKCPECVNTEMLSTDLSHMIERSRCIDKFSQIYGCMPLKPVEFRADPVLYKDNFPDKLKRFKGVGSL
ncbi:Exostoses (Multiple)-like 3 [Chamberlinius hualienensis]